MNGSTAKGENQSPDIQENQHDNASPAMDWDPTSKTALHAPCEKVDAMRERCPVARSELLQWSLFRHEDVVRVLHDHKTFSNAVSKYLAVPNGMDPPEHTEYRPITERYFGPEQMALFEPECRDIAADLRQTLVNRDEVEFIAEFADPFAVQAQCAFLGWPSSMHKPLSHWMQKNHAATLAQNREAMEALATEFETYIVDLLHVRRKAGNHAPEDVTTHLMRETVYGRPLNDKELVSILRNWTVGEVGTIATSIGILAHFLAHDFALQERLRKEPELLPIAIDEMLRVHGPLMASRRITTCPVEIGGRPIGARERISLNWVAANRDGRVFEDPETIKLDRDPSKNLLYGAGIHVCPGAPLARLEMLVVMEDLLAHTERIEPIPGKDAALANYPASGYSRLPLVLR